MDGGYTKNIGNERMHEKKHKQITRSYCYQKFHQFSQHEAPSSGEGEQLVQGTQESCQYQLLPSLACVAQTWRLELPELGFLLALGSPSYLNQRDDQSV
jgi:hypothetical protein